MLGWLEGACHRVLRLNPCVLLHDLRLRMRTNSVFWLMLVMALLCAASVALPFVHRAVEYATHGRSLDDLGEIGRDGMMILSFTLLTLMLLILPAWASASISGERERDTLAVLRSTMLSAADVAYGKFLGTVVYASMLLSVSLPFAAWCIMLGAISPREVAVIYAVIVSFAICVAGVGVWMSALCKRVISAVISTYVILVAIFGGIILILFLESELRGVTGQVFLDIVLALSAVVPAAITAWTVAVVVRWIIARTGRAQGQKARAILVVIVFGVAMLAIASLAETHGVLGAWSEEDLAVANPFLAILGIFEVDYPPWGAIWTCAAIAAVGCMGAARCLRLREFHPVYVEDIFINAWRRVRSARAASAEA
ncbi:MAG: hypothetical protein GF393_03310 [Armatimonadia bacterium]|nr:hypothetical protein [Armatimonadia bacterium]